MKARTTSYGQIEVVESHTGGEPTRVVLSGGPDLGHGALSERLELFRENHESFRKAVVTEPRGSGVIVGALLCTPIDRESVGAVIFFNNVGYLGMCGHGLIGLTKTLSYLGQIEPGRHQIETPVGYVMTELLPSGEVMFDNVESYQYMHEVEIELESGERVIGDVAWGGNWFFIVDSPELDLSLANVAFLTDRTKAIRHAVGQAGITGRNNVEIDHIELCGPAHERVNQSRNFVLCPGDAFDRSPCGTGTSAKVACLYQEGILSEGEVWRQEGIVGSVFEASVRVRESKITPMIKGNAHITAESRMLLDPMDPFVYGFQEPQ